MTKFDLARISIRLTLCTVVVFLGACATVPVTDGTQYLANGEKVSSLPWNKPQTWEGQGALGALAGQGGNFGGR